MSERQGITEAVHVFEGHRAFVEAMKIVEDSRYKIGTREFLINLIDHWAFELTGVYPPGTPLEIGVAHPIRRVAHLLTLIMQEYPGADVLGGIFSIYKFEDRGTAFFPTSRAVGELMARLLNSGKSNNSYYEPCCGTAGISMQLILERWSSLGMEGFQNFRIHLEDIDPLMVKASLIQLNNLFVALDVSPASLLISQIDVLSRNAGQIQYYLERAPGCLPSLKRED